MNSKNIVAITNEKTCMCCLSETEDLNMICIPEMGYGSAFDGEGTKILLCPSCYEKSNPEIWNMEQHVEKDENGNFCYEEYTHEEEMLNYINTLPIQSKELIWNRYNHGIHADHKMEPQDWIDFLLDELPYDKCKEYNRYAPEDFNAYNERFPKCEYPVDIIYPDNNKSCKCVLKYASGKFGQTTLHCSDSCYKCEYYKERTSKRKIIKRKDYDLCQISIKSKVREKEIKEKLGN